MDESMQSGPPALSSNISHQREKVVFTPNQHLSLLLEESESKQNHRSNRSSQFEGKQPLMEPISLKQSSFSLKQSASFTFKSPLEDVEDESNLDAPFCNEFILSTDSTHSQHDTNHSDSYNQNQNSITTTVFQSSPIPTSAGQTTGKASDYLRPCDVMISFNPDEDDDVMGLLIEVADSLNPDLFDEMVSYFDF
jgi:hypothetical protein